MRANVSWTIIALGTCSPTRGMSVVTESVVTESVSGMSVVTESVSRQSYSALAMRSAVTGKTLFSYRIFENILGNF